MCRLQRFGRSAFRLPKCIASSLTHPVEKRGMETLRSMSPFVVLVMFHSADIIHVSLMPEKLTFPPFF